MSKTERDTFFNGLTGRDGKRKEHRVIGIRGLKVAEDLKALSNPLQETRAARCFNPTFPNPSDIWLGW